LPGKTKIKWLKFARDDLYSVEQYISRQNPSAAVKQVLKVIACLELLRENPALGRPGRIPGTRELIVADTPFIVPYRKKGNSIEILRVFHHARKWPKEM